MGEREIFVFALLAGAAFLIWELSRTMTADAEEYSPEPFDLPASPEYDFYSLNQDYPMQLSANGERFIKSSEGLSLTPIADGTKQQIGYGHNIRPGEVFPSRITQEYADHLFEADAVKFENAINSLVVVPLTQGQFDALVSFAYNLGTGALQSSSLLAKLNAGDFQGAANEFQKWNHVNGLQVFGLTQRRKSEQQMFLA